MHTLLSIWVSKIIAVAFNIVETWVFLIHVQMEPWQHAQLGENGNTEWIPAFVGGPLGSTVHYKAYVSAKRIL